MEGEKGWDLCYVNPYGISFVLDNNRTIGDDVTIAFVTMETIEIIGISWNFLCFMKIVKDSDAVK